MTEGKYRLERRLGGGGMAEVFTAAVVGAEGFSRRVAIKRVLPGLCDNPHFAKMFVAEAKISSRLKHPNIVSVNDFERGADNRLYLVMELVEGKDLDTLASSGVLPFPVIIFVISEALRGLGYAHDLPVVDESVLMGSETVRSMKGVVHRDVSPHNVLVSWQGEVKVSDFGIAKARTADNATASEMIKGKPSYMSPEQANGAHLDGRSDLFAVGVMLWELLCSRRLFAADDTRAVIAAVMFGQIPRPRTVRPEIPKDLERVAMRLLERDLDKRYATAEQAIDDLMQCESAAPDGREQLKRVMAERFPREAPVRHSVLRGRSAADAPKPAPRSLPSHELPTIHAGMNSARAPYPSAAPTPAHADAFGPTASLETRTAAPVPPRISQPGARFPFAIVGGVIVVAIAAVAIVGATRSGHGERPASSEQPSVRGSGSTHGAVIASASPHDVPVVIPAVAPTVDVAVTTAPSDANVAVLADAPTRPIMAIDAGAKQTTPSVPTTQRRGRLEVTAFPALTVYIDGTKRHDTPFETELTVGRHVVRLINRDIGHDETVVVTVQDNKLTKIDRE